MSLSDLKRKAASLDTLVQAAQKESTASPVSVEDRFWKPEVDKSGNGYAVLRFLPAGEGEDLPWAKYWTHFFKSPSGQWFIDNCRTSINDACPVCESNNALWNSGYEADKETARDRKRRLHYVANVYVVSDTANPENEGKVFLYKFGRKIFDKLMDAMQPQFADEDPINPFDLWEGADFKLKIRNVEGYRNYDKSEFASPKPLLDGDDDELETVYNKIYPLKEFTNPSDYKPYAEMKARLNQVLGSDVALTTAEQVSLDIDEPVSSVEPTPTIETTSSSDDSEDALSYFARLAND